ncbi:FTR1 family iron permease [Alteromonas sp. KS69]|mgnify:CR=1 FL=1|jgi:high-affinity iron transporter|uniref:FTR1 family iron permease n=1 Tax=unclassified Alteromonas TaxID=2614992 RepID=UPI000F897F23|nr:MULTISPECIES: FTR1 family iron permease [unclassified Alteromonas]MBO7922832.1 FTR1 family iron permease [Alteromonas sp. K632G]RUP83845.1 FTR1 family iron permease [Alteromonas sp. KS69]|tara:strand:+ start:19406 stop:20170 length:765 start_codon:yes stop_codon:yes gene_type:complete
MLINTVVLFLRDTLPIFLLLSVLLALPGVSRLSLVWRIASLLVTAAMTYSYLGVISQLAEGAGFELLKSLLLVTAWIGICTLVIFPLSRCYLVSVGITLLVLGIGLPNSLHFMVYFVSELSRNSDSTLLFLGTTIGLGISISIAILLNIALTHFLSHKATFFFTTVFVAAQVANIALLLEQIDILPTPQQVWDSSQIINDNSEYGHLLNALIGYEATPSMSYIMLFIFTLVVPNGIAAIRKRIPALWQQVEDTQ